MLSSPSKWSVGRLWHLVSEPERNWGLKSTEDFDLGSVSRGPTSYLVSCCQPQHCRWMVGGDDFPPCPPFSRLCMERARGVGGFSKSGGLEGPPWCCFPRATPPHGPGPVPRNSQSPCLERRACGEVRHRGLTCVHPVRLSCHLCAERYTYGGHRENRAEPPQRVKWRACTTPDGQVSYKTVRAWSEPMVRSL